MERIADRRVGAALEEGLGGFEVSFLRGEMQRGHLLDPEAADEQPTLCGLVSRWMGSAERLLLPQPTR